MQINFKNWGEKKDQNPIAKDMKRKLEKRYKNGS